MLRLKVKEVAESRGFNMSSLSRASDVSFKTVKRIWKEPWIGVNTTTLERLAKALDVSVAELFEEVPEE
jgi:DNA-binding Xre family transcriptional regulator